MQFFTKTNGSIPIGILEGFLRYNMEVHTIEHYKA